MKSVFLLAFTATLALFTGCATPQSFRTVDQAERRMPALGRIVVAPIDAELAEFTAGGALERHQEWTTTAVKHLSAALATETGYRVASADESGPLKIEREEVQALIRALTLHRRSTLIAGGAAPFQVPPDLTYNTGPLPQHADALEAQAVLFVFIRDSYATAGRKSLVALSLVGAALTGVAVVPAMGSTAMSAALVDRDGTVLWFNLVGGGGDPRTPEGAKSLVRTLLAGLPSAKAGA